jgi:exosortase
LVERTAVSSFHRKGNLQWQPTQIVARKKKNIGFSHFAESLLHDDPQHGLSSVFLCGLGLVLGVFIWSYWSTITNLWHIWMRSDEYSSGLLVPFLAIYLLWLRRKELSQCPIKPCLWGFLIFLLAQAFRYFGLLFMFASAERLSLVFSLMGILLLLLGKKFFVKLFPLMLFLFLMLPLPKRFENQITLPLQSWATSSAVFSLEILGYDVTREGNIIHLITGQGKITTVAVAEACNGLRMVTSFFVISSLVILIVHRIWWEKLLLFLSTLPIALLCNTIRLAITSIAFTLLEGEQWEKIFHDFGGYAMMPLALGIVILELWIFNKLIQNPTGNESPPASGIYTVR